MRGPGTERPVGAEKSGKPDGAKGSRHPACGEGQPREREEPSSQAKSFSISKKVVVEAFRRVKANGGAAGVDAESIAAFEEDLKNNLYKIWNRMSSGTYFPPPVRAVGIPKKDGGERRLGIPTVGDRVAQTVVKMYLEPAVEPYFHPDSYGYRPSTARTTIVRDGIPIVNLYSDSAPMGCPRNRGNSKTCWKRRRRRSPIPPMLFTIGISALTGEPEARRAPAGRYA